MGLEVMEPDINPNNTVQARLTVPGARQMGPGRGRREGNMWVSYHGSNRSEMKALKNKGEFKMLLGCG